MRRVWFEIYDRTLIANLGGFRLEQYHRIFCVLVFRRSPRVEFCTSRVGLTAKDYKDVYLGFERGFREFTC